MAKLTDKQRDFVEQYLVDLNATQAAIRAGYSEKTAKEAGYENLTKPHIAEAVRGAFEERSKRTEVTQDWVLRTLVSNVERAMQVEPVLDADGNESGRYTYQGSVANKALELVGKHLGMFGKDDGVNVTVNLQARQDKERERVEKFGRLFDQLDAYRAGYDAGNGGSGGGVPVDTGGTDHPATEVP